MLLTEAEAATYLNVSKYCLQQWRFKKKGPAYTRLTRTVRYLKQDLDTFILNNLVTHDEV